MKKAFDQIYQRHGESIRKISMHHTDEGYDAEVYLKHGDEPMLYLFDSEEKMVSSTDMGTWNQGGKLL